MKKIALVTDSTSYLSNEWASQNDVTIISLVVNFGTKSYREGIDIEIDEFYHLLQAEKELPLTSQPPVGEFIQTFEELLKTHDHVVGIFLSSGISGTYNSAEAAARMVGGNITIIDSRLTVYTLSEAIREAVKLRDEGIDLDEIIARMQYVADNSGAFFVVDSLEHIARGGRISGVAAMVGSLLQVKPILTLEDGKIGVFEKIRTKKKALDRVIQVLHERKDPQKELHLCVAYAQNLSSAEEFREQIMNEFPGLEPDLCEIGPVVGTHIGPGLLAVIFWQ